MSELRGNHRGKLHALARDGVPKVEHAGVETEAMDGVVAIAILRVAADGMAHVGGVDANLVLAS